MIKMLRKIKIKTTFGSESKLQKLSRRKEYEWKEWYKKRKEW